jgi:phosphate acyltransferase
MLIAVDAMGGDRAPGEIVRGALDCCRRVDAQIALVGDPDALEAAISEYGPRPGNIVVKPASQAVEMGESATAAIRYKRDSSLAVAVGMVRDQEAAAVVSAGNSGAFLAMAHLFVRPIPGILRPAIGVVMPGLKGPWVLIDGGANADCRPVHLLQFGVMASIYCERALGIANPAVGVLSIGEEKGKGSELTIAAAELLSAAPVNFIGNIEGDRILSGETQVVVADGFAGNVALKVIEGVAHGWLEAMREQIAGSFRAKVGAYLMRPVFRHMKQLFDYSTYGGALLLGVNGICVVGHGRSDARAIDNAIHVAYRAVQGRVVEHMVTAVGELQPVPEGK